MYSPSSCRYIWLSRFAAAGIFESCSDALRFCGYSVIVILYRASRGGALRSRTSTPGWIIPAVRCASEWGELIRTTSPPNIGPIATVHSTTHGWVKLLRLGAFQSWVLSVSRSIPSGICLRVYSVRIGLTHTTFRLPRGVPRTHCIHSRRVAHDGCMMYATTR